MAHLVLAAFLVAASFISESVQQEGGLACEISSGLGVADKLNYTLAAADNCTSGTISWHYPMGTLTVNFPRTVLPELAHVRRKMKVCFRGGIGQGVSSITQKIPRRNRIAMHEMQLVDSLREWVCSRPSRCPAGIKVTLNSPLKQSPKFYLKAVHYRVEVVHPKSGKNKGRDRGNRHGKGRPDRHGKGRGNRQGKSSGRGHRQGGRKDRKNRQL